MKRTLLLYFTLLTVVWRLLPNPVFPLTKTHGFGQIEWKTSGNGKNIPSLIPEPSLLVLTNVTRLPVPVPWPTGQRNHCPGRPKELWKPLLTRRKRWDIWKSIGIYSNATPNLVYLKFTGEVVQGNQRLFENFFFTPSAIFVWTLTSSPFPMSIADSRPWRFWYCQSFWPSLRTGIDAPASLSEMEAETQSLAER